MLTATVMPLLTAYGSSAACVPPKTEGLQFGKYSGGFGPNYDYILCDAPRRFFTCRVWRLCMTKLRMSLMAAGVALLLAPASAQAQFPCPIAVPFEITCNGPGGCTQTVTLYGCNGYGNLQTCGGPGCPTISCCGHVAGYKPLSCSQDLCAGCEKNGKAKSTVAKSVKPNRPPATDANATRPEPAIQEVTPAEKVVAGTPSGGKR